MKTVMHRTAAAGSALAVALVGAGFVAGLLPWALFALSSIGDFRAQNAGFAERVQLFRPRFYLENLSPGRYPAGVEHQERVSTVTLVVPASPAAFVNLGTVRCAPPKESGKNP